MTPKPGPTQFRLSIEGVRQRHRGVVGQQAGGERMREPGQTCSNISSDAGSSGPSAYISVDRDTASRLGVIATSTIDDALYSAFRPAHRLDDFYRDQPVPRDSGSHARPAQHGGIAGQPAAENQLGRHHSAVQHGHHQLSDRRRCRSPAWPSTRPPPWVLTPRPAYRWARRSTRSNRPPKTSPCPPA